MTRSAVFTHTNMRNLVQFVGSSKGCMEKKKKKTLMKQDPNELHVAMENKSIKVGGVSAGEQLYDFVVG